MKKKTRKKVKIIRIGDKLVEVTTIAGMAEIIGKSVDTIRRYEKMDVFMTAPLMDDTGVRYYPISFCEALRPLVKTIPTNKKVPAELQTKINQLFQKEYKSQQG